METDGAGALSDVISDVIYETLPFAKLFFLEDDSAMDSPHWIDAHCHLADPRLAENLDSLLGRSIEAGVDHWIQGGIDPVDWERQRQLKKRYGTRISTAFGLHPWWVANHSRSEIEAELERLSNEVGEASALGELGLDCGEKFKQSYELQHWVFSKQLQLGSRVQKPLILHIVRAHEPALEILKTHKGKLSGGIVHSFSGSWEVAKSYISLGFLISVGGSVTRKGFESLKQAIPLLPLDKLVVETDAPDQTPNLAGVEMLDLNEPKNLIGIGAKIAELKGLETKTVLDQSAENLRKLFGIMP